MQYFILGFFLFISLGEFFLANYVFYKDNGAGYRHLAAARGLMAGFFCLFSVFFYSATSYTSAFLWNQIRAIPFIFLPAFTFHFTWKWTQRRGNELARKWSLLLYASAFAFAIANLFTAILGYPVHDQVFYWNTLAADTTIWPLAFSAWGIGLVGFSFMQGLFFYPGIKSQDERQKQLPVFLGLLIPPVLAVVLSLLPIPGMPGLLVHLPLWIFVSDIFIAIGLTSRYFYGISFTSAYYPIIQSMNEAAALIDLNFILRAVNAAFCRLVDRNETELVGVPASEAFPDDIFPIQQIKKEIVQQGSSKYSVDLEYENGKPVHAGLQATPVFDRLGRLRAITILIDDHLDIKDAEARLNARHLESEQKNKSQINDLMKANEMLEADLGKCKEEAMQWRSQVFELESLSNLSSALRTARTVQEMLSTLLTETTQILKANNGLILLKSDSNLVIKSLYGLPEDLKGSRYPMGEGLFSQVFNGGQPVYLREIEPPSTTGLPSFIQSCTSLVLLPLDTAEKKLGLMVFGFNYRKNFDEFDQKLISSIRNLTSNALYRSNMIDSLEQRLVSRNRELLTLFKIASISNEAREPDTVLEQTLKILLDTLDSRLGVIYVDGKMGETHIAAHNEDIQPEVLNELKEITLENSLWGFIFHTNQPLLVDSLDDDRRVDIRIVTELIPLGNCTFIGTPIRGSNETLGAICFFRQPGQPYTQEDLALLGTAAHQLGVAIEVILLRKQERQSASRIEHQRLGSELYDSISQLLSSSFLYADASRKLIQSGDVANLTTNVEQFRQSSLQALKDIRVLIHKLRPASIENLGLFGAIQHRLDMVERRAHIETTLSGEYAFKLPGNMEESLYQIIEEMLNYSARYSRATEVEIKLESDYDSITLEFKDNGNGKYPTDSAKKTILSNLRERVENLGGSFELKMVPNTGTIMHVNF